MDNDSQMPFEDDREPMSLEALDEYMDYLRAAREELMGVLTDPEQKRLRWLFRLRTLGQLRLAELRDGGLDAKLMAQLRSNAEADGGHGDIFSESVLANDGWKQVNSDGPVRWYPPDPEPGW